VSYEWARHVLDLIERETLDMGGALIPIVPTWVAIDDGQFSSLNLPGRPAAMMSLTDLSPESWSYLVSTLSVTPGTSMS
jgi:hypothetical protein